MIEIVVYTVIIVLFAAVIHEFGHMLGGLLSGVYSLHSVTVFHIRINAEYSISRIKRLNGLGQCIMLPTEQFDEKSGDLQMKSCYCLLLGGITATAVMAVAGIWLCFCGVFWGYAMSMVNIFFLICNAVPIGSNDAATYLELRRNHEMLEAYHSLLRIAAVLADGDKKDDGNTSLREEWFRMANKDAGRSSLCRELYELAEEYGMSNHIDTSIIHT